MSRTAEAGERGRWRLKVDLPEAVAKLRDALIDCVIATADRGTVAPLRRSRRAVTYNAHFLALSEHPGDVFIKVIDRPRGVDRVKRWLRGSSAAHVKRITAQLCAAGLAAPPVWIWGYHRRDGRELIVTPRAEGAGPLRTLAALNDDPVEKRRLLKDLGVEIARLHRAGFVHGDLTPFNIFVTLGGRPRFILLDHERTRRSLGPGRRRRSLRNLVQLGRFTLPGLSESDRLRVLRAYSEAMGLGDWRRMARRVARMLATRLARDGGAQIVAPLRPLSCRSAGRAGRG